MKNYPLILGLLLVPFILSAQSFMAPLGSPSEQIAERWLIRSGVEAGIHAEIKGYAGRDLAELADRLLRMQDTLGLSRLEKAELYYLADQYNEWSDSTHLRAKPLLRYFFRSPAHVFELTKYGGKDKKRPVFSLRINPLLNVRAGRDLEDSTLLFMNQRGLEARAVIDRKVYVYTSLVETQVQLPGYVNEWTETYKAVPGAGWYKNYRSSILSTPMGRDVNVANAYVGFQATKHIGVQFGHGTHFIGNGYRSLFLSGFAPPAFFLKFSTRIWKFHYQNLFVELSPTTVNQVGSGLLPKKYAAMHYLHFRPTKNLAFGLFEAVVFNRSRQLEWQYLNPVILYRSIEGMIGSPDNMLIGLDARWNLWRRFQVYGQLLMDEFLYKELVSRSGWWANKYGIQAGAKYVNAFGIPQLDIQVEYNSARPFTWSHYDSLNSLTHYNQALAHPLGANFREMIGIVRWRPHPNWTLTGRYLHLRTGDDEPGKNYGTNPLLSYQSRALDYGNEIGQGIGAVTDLTGLDVSWQFYRNTYLDVSVLLRRKNSESAALDSRHRIFSAGIRMNLVSPNFDF